MVGVQVGCGIYRSFLDVLIYFYNILYLVCEVEIMAKKTVSRKRKKAAAMKRIREGTLEGLQVDESRRIEIGILRKRIRVFEHNKPDKQYRINEKCKPLPAIQRLCGKRWVKVCMHDNQPSQCKEAECIEHASRICQHGKHKQICKEAECIEHASGICQHGREKARCKEAECIEHASGICQHGRDKRVCKEEECVHLRQTKKRKL